ncbi:hypothetical protein QYF36_008515 [Acer negundo]|nr:hypothetical protein QYF36_008515 [Acer negundo]
MLPIQRRRVANQSDSKDTDYQQNEDSTKEFFNWKKSFAKALKGNQASKGMMDNKKVVQQKQRFSRLGTGGFAVVAEVISLRKQHREVEIKAEGTIGCLQKRCQPILASVEEKKFGKEAYYSYSRLEEWVEGRISNLKKWRGDCSKTVRIVGGKKGAETGNFGPDIPYVSRSPSLDDKLKEYLNKIEQAFIWANYKNGLDNQVENKEGVHRSPNEMPSKDNSVSVVEESRDSSEDKQGMIKLWCQASRGQFQQLRKMK